MIRRDAMKVLEQKALQEGKAEGEEREKALLDGMVERLLRGERLSGEEGRQIMWEFLCNAPAVNQQVFTGNSQTFYRLGLLEWPRQKIKWLKDEYFSLYQKMEGEANRREKQNG